MTGIPRCPNCASARLQQTWSKRMKCLDCLARFNINDMNPTKEQIRYLHQQNRLYPRELRRVERHEWPPLVKAASPIEVYRSSTFLVQVFNERDAIRLSINRTMVNKAGQWLEDITWDDLQRLKRECGHGNAIAIEFYPPDRDVVNVANMRHLWLPKSTVIPQHWRHVELPKPGSEVPYL